MKLDVNSQASPIASVEVPTPRYDATFLAHNKDYYRNIEDYDWVEVTDKWKGIEAVFHRLRARAVKDLVARAGHSGPYLDAGCGTGLNLRHLPPGATGIDINPRNLPRASRWAPLARILRADLECLPFADGSFSTVVCTEVLEHFPNPESPLSEIVRILRPGGVLIGTVPAQSAIWRLRFLSSTCPGEEPYHKNYHREELRNLVAPAGLRLSLLKRACLGMSWMFVAEKPEMAESH